MPRGSAATNDAAQLGIKLGQVGDYWLSQRPGSPKWYKTWYDGDKRQTVRESLRTSDFREAHAALIAEVARHPVADRKHPSKVALHDALVWYYEGRAKELPSWESRKIAFGYWTQFFSSSFTVADLKPLKIEAFKTFLQGLDLSDAYVAKIISDGRAALNWCHFNQLVSEVPRIKTGFTAAVLEACPPKGRPLSIEEMARLFVADPAPHIRIMLAIMINTLCRPGAAKDLARPQVDFVHGLVNLNPKGRRQTIKRRALVPLTPSLRATLLRAEGEQIEAAARAGIRDFEPDRYVLFRGKPITHHFEGFRGAAERAGFDLDQDTVTSYSIRHTMARELRKVRVPTEEIQVYMGHKPPSTGVTSIYAPYTPEFLKDAAEVVEAYVNQLRTQVVEMGGDPSYL